MAVGRAPGIQRKQLQLPADAVHGEVHHPLVVIREKQLPYRAVLSRNIQLELFEDGGGYMVGLEV